MPGTLLTAGETAMNERDKYFCLHGAYILLEEAVNSIGRDSVEYVG